MKHIRALKIQILLNLNPPEILERVYQTADEAEIISRRGQPLANVSILVLTGRICFAQCIGSENSRHK
jgi:hypothetical protein